MFFVVDDEDEIVFLAFSAFSVLGDGGAAEV